MRLFMLWSFSRTAIFFNCTICLHSTLFVCTTLIINTLRSVDNPVFCMHAVCTCLHLSALVCTLYALVCTPFITHLCTKLHDGYTTYTIRYRGSRFLVGATEKSASRYCANRPTQALRHAAVAEKTEEELACRLSAGKCR